MSPLLFSYLAHRRCEGYGRADVYEPGRFENSAHFRDRDEAEGVEIERPRARRENQGVACPPASNMLRDARFASRFLFLLSFFSPAQMSTLRRASAN